MEPAAAGKKRGRRTSVVHHSQPLSNDAIMAEVNGTAAAPQTKRATTDARSNGSKCSLGGAMEEDSDDEMLFEDNDSDEEVFDEENQFDDEKEMDINDLNKKQSTRVFRPGVDACGEEEELDYDPAAYEMYHKVDTEWPCLTLDILKDDLGACRNKYPHQMYVVAGTQAANPKDNQLYVMKWSKLCKMQQDLSDSEDEDSDSDDEEDDDPIMEHRAIATGCGINRIRAMPQARICATWGDNGVVSMWNIHKEYDSLDTRKTIPDANPKPLFTFNGHQDEGYAMSWNPHTVGAFVSGDNRGAIRLWNPVEGGWAVQNEIFSGHTGSVEDVEWKPKGDGAEVCFASCSSDKTVQIWDIRSNNRSSAAIKIQAHDDDVNVLSWNPLVEQLLVTGGDDGEFKVWDIRNVKAGYMANLQASKAPVTSVSWHPTDETALAVATADNNITLWDLAVENDDDEEVDQDYEGIEDFPEQMLFLHHQPDIKEIMWHPQIPGCVVSTGGDGFNVFKPTKKCNF